MLVRGLINRVLDSYMIVMSGNVHNQTSVSYGTETEILILGPFLIAYAAILWYIVNKLIDSTRIHDNLPSKIELAEYGR